MTIAVDMGRKATKTKNKSWQVVHWLKSNRNALNLVYPQSISRMARYLGWIQGLVKLIDICLMIIESYPAKTFYLKISSAHCIC